MGCVRDTIVVLGLSAVVLLPRPVLAQSDTASLTVVVTDQSGAVVPGAAVSIRNVETGAGRDGPTDATGRVTFTLLSAGKYETIVGLTGFRPYHDPSFQLRMGQPATLNVVLEIGQTTEAVEVRAPVRLINLDSAAHGTVITEERLQALPLNGRQFIQLALLVPSANPGGERSSRTRPDD